MSSAILQFPFRVSSRSREAFRALAIICSTAVISFVAFAILAGLVSWDLFSCLAICGVFVIALCIARPFSASALAGSKEAFLSTSLVIWVFLMVSEGVFVHWGSSDSAAGGHFDPSAYYEAASWMLSFVALAFITFFRPNYLRMLFKGRLKWATIFAIIAVLSCPLSPVFLYSLIMAFKLSVVVLTLVAIAEVSHDEIGVPTIFSALFVGILILSIAGTAVPLVGPGHVFNGTRYGAVIGLSGTAGLLLLLSVVYLLLKKNPWFLLSGFFGLTMMILAGGKGGIIASVLALMMFFILLKRAAHALVLCTALVGVFLLLVAFTPVGGTLQQYSRSSNAGTLSGRTNLWAAVWPEIKQRPIFGHGYRSSRVVSSEVEGAFAEAGHIHNAFLEVLYNNGLLGLIPILLMNFFIVANLRHVIKHQLSPETRYYTAAALAIYIQLLLWGMTAPTFGGTPDHRFMIFFALLLISIHLRTSSDREALPSNERPA